MVMYAANISLSVPWASDQAIIQAARMAHVDQFVNQHPAGYAMPIGEHGSGLSGGQRQAIAIARAILSNPAILLLDEPTSSIDSASERAILQNLVQFAANKTLIIITHKAALLSIVDRLIVLTAGEIVADGPKQEIITVLQEKVSQKKKRNKKDEAAKI